MNGQRLLETQEDNQKWKIDKVTKSEGLKPGIYNIYLAKAVESLSAKSTSEFSGLVIHINDQSVIQKVGMEYIAHDINKFDKKPSVGEGIRIVYDKNKKIDSAKALDTKISRKHSL